MWRKTILPALLSFRGCQALPEHTLYRPWLLTAVRHNTGKSNEYHAVLLRGAEERLGKTSLKSLQREDVTVGEESPTRNRAGSCCASTCFLSAHSLVQD